MQPSGRQLTLHCLRLADPQQRRQLGWGQAAVRLRSDREMRLRSAAGVSSHKTSMQASKERHSPARELGL